jgi:hypothetical protein
LAGPLVAGPEAANWTKAVEARVDAILTDFPIDLSKQLRTK